MPEARDIVVLGAGIVGLCTALRAQARGMRVTIVTRDRPPQTTSAVAAAIWYPYLAEHERAAAWASATRDWLCSLPAEAGIAMCQVRERMPTGQDDKYVEAPVADTRRLLPWLLAQFEAAGGHLVVRQVASLDEAFAYGELVCNCTGLGARELCNDSRVYPVRGQVLLVTGCEIRTGLIDDTGKAPVYIVPRGDQVVLGGTAQPHDERTEVSAVDTRRILADCSAHMPQLASATIDAVRAGLRPYRDTIRVERTGDIVHHYGHGGSGFTLAYGSAGDAVGLLS